MAIITVIAAFAALSGTGVASATPRPAAPPVAATAPAPAAPVYGGFGIIASWAEEASWADS